MAVAKMPRKPRVDFEAIKPRIIADWRTGAYTIRDLGHKYSVSHTFINQLTKSVACDTESTVSKIVELNHEVAGLDFLAVSSVNEVANNRLRFETQSNARMELVSLKAMEFLDTADKVADLTPIMGVLKTHRESVLGKSPDTAIQINNAEAAGLKINLVQYSEQSPDQ